jgi:SecY interacting protein Syd
MNNLLSALSDFNQRYVDLWQQQQGSYPQSDAYADMLSPCQISSTATDVCWQPVATNPVNDLQRVEQLVGIAIRPEIQALFGMQYAGDMWACFQGITLCLIQVWNQDDFYRLEQNQIAHLQMLKKLKRQPSLFIATTQDDSRIITVNNVTGAVILDDLITGEHQYLSGDLTDFLTQLTPIII